MGWGGWGCCVEAAVFQDAVCWKSLLCALHKQVPGIPLLVLCSLLSRAHAAPLVDPVQAPATGCSLPDRLPSV